MYLDSAKKQELFEKYGKSATNTGSAESQIALFTFRISHLTEHLKVNHKDYATERSLKMLVSITRQKPIYSVLFRYIQLGVSSPLPMASHRYSHPYRS